MGKNPNFNKTTFLPYKKRIGDIAVTNFYMEDDIPKPFQRHLNIPPFSFIQILKYQPNPYYGKEEDYDIDGEYYNPKGIDNLHSIHKSCFQNPESTYMLAYWEDMDDEMCSPDLKIISNRLFDLSEEEQHQFLKLAALGQRYIQSQLAKSIKQEE